MDIKQLQKELREQELMLLREAEGFAPLQSEHHVRKARAQLLRQAAGAISNLQAIALYLAKKLPEEEATCLRNRIQAALRICTCERPQFAMMNPVVAPWASPAEEAAMEKYRAYFGKLVCYDCGGVWTGEGKIPAADGVTGSTIAGRLEELGVL